MVYETKLFIRETTHKKCTPIFFNERITLYSKQTREPFGETFAKKILKNIKNKLVD